MASITGSKVGGDLRAGSARLVCRRTWAAALATLDQGSARCWCTASGSGLAKMRPSVLISVCSRAEPCLTDLTSLGNLYWEPGSPDVVSPTVTAATSSDVAPSGERSWGER